MREKKKNKVIIEPLWYVKHISIVSKRNQKAPWELIIPIFLPVFMVIFFTQILSNILSKQTISIVSIILLILLAILFYYIARKYIVEKGLDIDRYSWVTFFSSRIGMDLYRLSNLSDYQHFIDANSISLRKWLFYLAFDYRGDKSGKKKKILELRIRLKSLPKIVKENRNNSQKMSNLGKKFLDLGENISKENPEIRIEAKYLDNLIKCLPEAKPGILFITWNILTNKVVVGFLVLLIGSVAGLISYFSLQFTLLNSILLMLATIPVITSIYTILTRK